MLIEMKLEQGTEEWLEMRRRFRMASETPAVMKLSPYSGPQQVRDAKAGKRGYVNAAMRRGTEEEPKARMWFEEQTSELMRPAVFTNGRYGASLDGISLDGKTILEIKTPYKETSERWELIFDGKIADYDMAQMQHQLMVTGAEECYFMVWSAEKQTGVIQIVKPDKDWWARIQEAWDDFDETIAERDDEQWELAVTEYQAAKRLFTHAEDRLEAAKKALIEIRLTDSDRGKGVRIAKVTRQGNIDWKVVQKNHLVGIDLDQYRAKSTEYFKVEDEK